MKEWHKLAKFLEDCGKLENGILLSMKKREVTVFQNSHLLAGVYVYPRYRILLSDEQLIKAKEGLFDIFRRLEKEKYCQKLNTSTDNACSENMSSSLEKFINHTLDSDEDEFEKQLDKTEKRQNFFNENW